MPELPEVETVRRGIEPHVLGQRIAAVTVRDRRLRWPIPPGLEAWLTGQRIDSASRRGKYLLLQMDTGDRLIVHLGMSGRLFALERDVPLKKHDHVDIVLDSGAILRFNDPRRFGAVLPWQAAEATHPLIANLGPEPLDAAFSDDHLYARSRGRRQSLKTFIMDGRTVVGVGNIYASEALFRAGLRPGTAAGRLTRPQAERLTAAIRATIADAIRQGGTTLRDFAGADGNPGYFQQDLYVYGRAGKPCRVCGEEIRARVIGQRSSFYCVQCQR